MYVEIPAGVHYNHRMVSALSFICMGVFVIVRVLVFVLVYTTQNTLLLDAIISTLKLIPCRLKKVISNIYSYLNRQHLLFAVKQPFLYIQNAE